MAVAVLTGGSAGVGRATARELASRGYDLALVARGDEALKATVAEIEGVGRRAIAVVADVADADAVEAAADRAEAELGPVDVWVNNAMTTVFSPALEMTAAEFRRVTEVTYLGYVHGTLAALRRMAPRGSGVVVQVGSALAYQGIPLQSAYCGAKHAIQGFTESVRAELRHDRSRIRLVEVHLPAINTPQFDWCRSHLDRRPQPVPPIFEPEAAAEAIADAIDGRREEVLLGGPTVKAVLGSTLAPWLMTRITASRAYEGQFTDQADEGGRDDNLYDPAPGDPGAHGSFGDRVVEGRPRSVLSFAGTATEVAGGVLASALGFGVRLIARR